MAYTRERAYQRYSFSAPAEITVGSGAPAHAEVTNISYGGCRVLTGVRLPVASPVFLKVQSQTDTFEARAKVMHCTGNDMGLMFGDISPQSLFVLQRWIAAAKDQQR